MNLNFYEQNSSVSFCNERSSLASLFKSSISYLLCNEIDALFMVAMGLEYLVLFIFLSCLSLFLLGDCCLLFVWAGFLLLSFWEVVFWVVWVLVGFLCVVWIF